MNNLSTAKRTAVIAALCEGMSIRGTVRMTGVAKNTIVKLIADLGAACSKYQDEHIRNVRARRVQCDEIWSFVGSKEKNTQRREEASRMGRLLDLDGPGRRHEADDFVPSRGSLTQHGLRLHARRAERLVGRIQLTTDGNRVYIEAVESAFRDEIDYAMLRKLYGADPEAPETRYSPAKCIGCEMKKISGNPDPKHVSTSYVERANLTMRMSMRRFTRLTNGFSKKLENHAAMVALYFLYYNFARIHQTLRVTPAMEAGIADHVWSIEEIVGLLASN